MSDYVSTTSFADLPLSEELRRGIADRGYVQPTPVQAAVIGPILAGRDLICRSKTGTGKTAAFGIPLLERIPGGTRKASALVLCNTRELALQVSQELEALAKHKNISVVAIYGGAPMGAQTDALRGGAEVIVGTPGRVYDHIRRGALKLDDTRIAVLDEADEMLSAGFFEEVTRILDHLPKDRQTLLFSATVPPDIEHLAARYLRDPETILLSGDTFTVEHIKNVIYDVVDQYPKPRNLLYLLEREDPDSAIVFCNTRTDTELIANVLNRNGLDAEMLNGDLPQKERERVMGKVKRGELKFMVATDIAARGIDISDLSHVINYSLPEDPSVYLHRVGRTGRIGKKGTAISLVSGAEIMTLSALQKRFGIEFEQRKLPTPEEAKTVWIEKHIKELRDAMQGGMAYDAFLSLAVDLSSRDEGRTLLAYALKYFFTHHRMEKAQARAAGEKLLESHKVDQSQREQKKARGEHDRSRRKPKLDRNHETADERAEGSGAKPPPERVKDTPSERAEAPAAAVDRVKLFVTPGAEDGWEKDAFADALCALAGQPRDSILAVDLKPRYAYVLVRPGSEQAYLATAGRALKEKPLTIEIARPRKR
ncbi:MAG: DEAD/DEAH box helicase [Myxococcales bacterium]